MKYCNLKLAQIQTEREGWISASDVHLNESTAFLFWFKIIMNNFEYLNNF